MDEFEMQKEYEEKDVVRKFQLEYNESVCMVEKFPEAMHAGKGANTENDEASENTINDTDNTLQAMLPNNNNNEQKKNSGHVRHE